MFSSVTYSSKNLSSFPLSKSQQERLTKAIDNSPKGVCINSIFILPGSIFCKLVMPPSWARVIN